MDEEIKWRVNWLIAVLGTEQEGWAQLCLDMAINRARQP